MHIGVITTSLPIEAVMKGRPQHRTRKGGITVTSAEVVGTISHIDRREYYPLDRGDNVWTLGQWRPKQGENAHIAAERVRAAVSGLIDDLLDRGRVCDAAAFLTSFSFLCARVSHFGIGRLLADFEHFLNSNVGRSHGEVRHVYEQLSFAEPILRLMPSQLPEQLLARLHRQGGRIDVIRRNAGETARYSSWLRPIGASLVDPMSGIARVLEGHSAAPTAVAFSSAGALLISADTRELCLWDTSTLTVVAKLKGHCAEVRSLTITSDDQFVAAATDDGAILCWHLQGSKKPRRLVPHSAAITAMAATQDNRLISASSDGTLALSCPSTENISCIGRLREPIHGLALGADRSSCITTSGVSFSRQSTVTQWDIAALRLTESRSYQGEDLGDVASCDDKRGILIAANEALLYWNLASRDSPIELGRHSWRILRLRTSADKSQAVTTDSGGGVRIWDLPGGKPRELKGHRLLVSGLAVGRDGRIATAGYHYTVRLWRPSSNANQTTRTAHSGAVTSIAACICDGRAIIASASEDHSIAFWDLSSKSELARVRAHNARVTQVLAFPHIGAWFSVGWDGTIALWNVRDGSQIKKCKVTDEHLESIAVDRHATKAVTSTFDGRINLWDLHTGAKLASLRPPMAVKRLAMTADGSRVVAVGNGVFLIDLCANRMKLVPLRISASSEPSPRIGRENAVAILRNKHCCLIGAADGQIGVLDLRRRAVLATWREGSGSVADISTSRCGHWAASVGGIPAANSDDTLRIWKSSTGQVAARFTGDCPMQCCALSPDGRYVAAGDRWGRVHFFLIEPPTATLRPRP